MAKDTITKDENVSLEKVISTAIQVPGVKVSREGFLRQQFQNKSPEKIDEIIALGPVDAGLSKEQLQKMATRIINEKTLYSTGASFLTGLPGGLAMAASIPADMLQFYGIALRMAQELAYLYGEADLWDGEFLDDDKVTNQLILYCGVMLGASGASQAVRIMSSALSKQLAKKLPQKALTKTLYYPVIKGISKFFGVSMTKGLFAKGVSKAVPILGGVVSGGITFATLRPMGQRLAQTLDNAHFSYTEQDFEDDIHDVLDISSEAEMETNGIKSPAEIVEAIERAKNLLDTGVLTESEFADIKSTLIRKL